MEEAPLTPQPPYPEVLPPLDDIDRHAPDPDVDAAIRQLNPGVPGSEIYPGDVELIRIDPNRPVSEQIMADAAAMGHPGELVGLTGRLPQVAGGRPKGYVDGETFVVRAQDTMAVTTEATRTRITPSLSMKKPDITGGESTMNVSVKNLRKRKRLFNTGPSVEFQTEPDVERRWHDHIPRPMRESGHVTVGRKSRGIKKETSDETFYAVDFYGTDGKLKNMAHINHETLMALLDRQLDNPDVVNDPDVSQDVKDSLPNAGTPRSTHFYWQELEPEVLPAHEKDIINIPPLDAEQDILGQLEEHKKTLGRDGLEGLVFDSLERTVRVVRDEPMDVLTPDGPKRVRTWSLRYSVPDIYGGEEVTERRQFQDKEFADYLNMLVAQNKKEGHDDIFNSLRWEIPRVDRAEVPFHLASLSTEELAWGGWLANGLPTHAEAHPRLNASGETITDDEALDKLSYGDILTGGDHADMLSQIEAMPNKDNYIEAMKTMVGEIGESELETMATKMRDSYLTIAKRLGLNTFGFDESLSWVYWELAKHRHLADNPGDAGPEDKDVTLHTPIGANINARNKRHEIVEERVGKVFEANAVKVDRKTVQKDPPELNDEKQPAFEILNIRRWNDIKLGKEGEVTRSYTDLIPYTVLEQIKEIFKPAFGVEAARRGIRLPNIAYIEAGRQLRRSIRQ